MSDFNHIELVVLPDNHKEFKGRPPNHVAFNATTRVLLVRESQRTFAAAVLKREAEELAK